MLVIQYSENGHKVKKLLCSCYGRTEMIHLCHCVSNRMLAFSRSSNVWPREPTPDYGLIRSGEICILDEASVRAQPSL